MTAAARRRPIHLVGSIPLADAEEVFRTTSSILGGEARRLPDGETGVRTNWIAWQAAVFEQNPVLERVNVTDKEYGSLLIYRLRSGKSAEDVEFENLGYAAAALQSYATFARLKQDGVIDQSTRFQVCLPTPLAPVTGFVSQQDRAAVEPAYERRMLAELAQICDTIPHDQLAIQWDTAIEFGILEGVMPTHLREPEQEIVERLIALGDRVPPDVELGYHLCYGDAGHRHFVQPQDTAKLVTVANRVSTGVTRAINWIHLPVPRDRDDVNYYAPLSDLKLKPETELYLGLVHMTDGLDGTRRRISAASQAVADFGIATECGFGRRPAESVPPLLTLHREAAEV